MKTDLSTQLNVFVSDKDILSDEDQMRLIGIRDSHRQDYFEIGTIANRYVRLSASTELPVTASRVYEAVGRFVGKRPRTIRYYAETAAFYDDKDISTFDMLPFSFFVLAQRHGEVGWREVLEYSALNPYISLDELERASAAGQFANFEKSEILPDQAGIGGGLLEAEPLPEVSTPRVLSKFAAGILLTTVSDLVDQVLRILRMVELPDDLRVRLEIDIGDLKSALPDVARQIDTIKQKEPN